jgi:antitoxin component of RelBE/YafQ-DinJ toxin-antitoxin module
MKTPIHSVRIDDQLWAQATSAAAIRGLSLSQVIREHLQTLTVRDQALVPESGELTQTAQQGGESDT